MCIPEACGIIPIFVDVHFPRAGREDGKPSVWRLQASRLFQDPGKDLIEAASAGASIRWCEKVEVS